MYNISQIGRKKYSAAKTTPVWSTQYQTYYDSLTVKPPDPIANKQSNLFDSWIAEGLFSLLDWSYMLAQYSNDNGEALTNILSPGTFDGELVGPVTFTSLEGTKGSGIGSYGKTGWNPSQDAVRMEANNAFVFCYVRSSGSDNKWEMGCNDGSNSIILGANYLGDLFGRLNSQSNIEVFNDPDLEPGFYFINLDNNTLTIGRNNYVLWKDTNYVPGALPNLEFYFNGYNNNGTPGWLSTRQQSFVGAGAALTDTQREALRTSIETYMDYNSKGVIDVLFGQKVDNYATVAALNLPDQIVIEPGVHFTAQDGKFRTPTVTLTNNNVLIVGTAVRNGSTSDYAITDTGIIRSINYGSSWLPEQLILEHSGVSDAPRAYNHSIVLDENTNRVFLFAKRVDDDSLYKYYGSDVDVDWDLVYVYSDDDGATWSNEISVKSLADTKTNIINTGSSRGGITMNDGTLILPIYTSRHSDNLTDEGTDWAHRAGFIYSTDNGANWSISSLVAAETLECTIVEYETGKLMILCRRWSGLNNARVFLTDDLGATWTEATSDKLPYSFQNNRALHKFVYNGSTKGLLSMNLNMKARTEIELLVSDDFITWKKFRQIYAGSAYGYTCIASNTAGKLFVVLEISDGIHLYDMTTFKDYL